MLKPYRRLKRNIDVGLDTEKLGTKTSTRNTPKQEIKLKAQSEKQKLIWRKKLHKMLKPIPRYFGNMLTPKEKLTLVYQS
jgi:hypothetical protein